MIHEDDDDRFFGIGEGFFLLFFLPTKHLICCSYFCHFHVLILHLEEPLSRLFALL